MVKIGLGPHAVVLPYRSNGDKILLFHAGLKPLMVKDIDPDFPVYNRGELGNGFYTSSNPEFVKHHRTRCYVSVYAFDLVSACNDSKINICVSKTQTGIGVYDLYVHSGNYNFTKRFGGQFYFHTTGALKYLEFLGSLRGTDISQLDDIVNVLVNGGTLPNHFVRYQHLL